MTGLDLDMLLTGLHPIGRGNKLEFLTVVETAEKSGHRERLRNRFLTGDESARTDVGLLELLLTFAIPRVDVQPLANSLIDKFGSLDSVLNASADSLCTVKGIKEQTATLIRLVATIRQRETSAKVKKSKPIVENHPLLVGVCDPATDSSDEDVGSSVQSSTKAKKLQSRKVGEKDPDVRISVSNRKSKQGTGVFGKALLQEAIELLPTMPVTKSFSEIRDFVQSNLRFNGQQTRIRNASYIMRRMFPSGVVDSELLRFAKKYAGKRELREVCFYRFLKTELLLGLAVDSVISPATSVGRTTRLHVREYIAEQFPESKSLKEGSRAIIDALVAGGIVKEEDKNTLTFQLRDVAIDSFAFILHSEFPEPGMHTFSQLQGNAAVRQMMWKPDSVIAALYELRNRKLLSKVSEIDNFKQFTTKFHLPELVTVLTQGAAA